MKRVSFVVLLVVCYVFFVMPIMAADGGEKGDRYVYPDNEFSYGVTLLYKYVEGKVRIVFWLRPGFWPEWGAMEVDLPSGDWAAQDYKFHSVEDGRPAKGFVSANDDTRFRFEQMLKIGYVEDPGPYKLQLLLSDGKGEQSYSVFYLNLPSFDFNESVCRPKRMKRRVALEFSISSVTPLPSKVDHVSIKMANGESLEFDDVPFAGGGSGNSWGWIRLPILMNAFRYNHLIGGKSPETSITINGNTVTWGKEMIYPAYLHARASCERG